MTRSRVKSGVSFKHIVGQEYRYIMNQSVMLRESPRVDMIIIGALKIPEVSNRVTVFMSYCLT